MCQRSVVHGWHEVQALEDQGKAIFGSPVMFQSVLICEVALESAIEKKPFPANSNAQSGLVPTYLHIQFRDVCLSALQICYIYMLT